MRNKIKVLILPIFLALTLSCTNYIRPVNTVKNHSLINGNPVLKINRDTLSLKVLGDYRFSRPNDSLIFTTNKELKQLLKRKQLRLPKNQILFTYTNMPIYNNVFGFYYNDLSLDSIQKLYDFKPKISRPNGMMYTYEYQDKTIADIYRETDHGIIRIICIGQPNYDSEKFLVSEVEYVFFENNENWWLE